MANGVDGLSELKQLLDSRQRIVMARVMRELEELRAKRMVENGGKFKELVEGKRVAVVGNAPTATVWGERSKIDSADVVIRFNRFVLGDYSGQIGDKTDVVACPLGYDPAVPFADLPTIKPRLILGVVPKIDHNVEQNLKRLESYNHCLIPTSYFARLHEQLGCRPTTGFATLCYLIEECRPSAVYVTGFSFEKFKKHHYFPAQSFAYTLHDPVKELHLYARKHRADLVELDPHMVNRMTQGQASHEYAELRRRGGKPYSAPHRWVYEQIAEHVGGKSVVEVGAGIGYGTRRMFKAGASRVVMVEPDTASFAYLRRELPDVEAFNGLLQDFPSAERFDVATCVEVLEHLPPVAVHPFLCRLRSLCGRLLLSTPDRRKHDHGRRTPLEMRLALKAAGFEVERVKQNAWATLYVCN